MQRGKNVVSVTEYMKLTVSLINRLVCILVSIPVSGAGCERAFSKLSRVKNELRSTMRAERLSGLMLMTVEKSIEEELNMQMCVDTFALKPKKS